MRSMRLRPNSWETMTPAPTFRPAATDSSRVVTGYDAPTAASASVPANWPATMLSTAL